MSLTLITGDGATSDFFSAREILNLRNENAELRARIAALEAENLKLLQKVIDRNMELGYYTEDLIERCNEARTRAQENV